MFEGLKLSGWKQGVYQESSTRKHVIGEKRHWNGKIFRYTKAGGAALTRAYLNQAVAVIAGLVNEAGIRAAGYAVGTRQMTLTVTAGATLSVDDLVGSDFIVNDNAGEGQCIPIVSNTALASGGTSLTITLGDRVRTALTSASEFTIQLSPWLLVAMANSTDLMPTGVPMIAVTADYYFWNQTRGMASVFHGTGGVATIGDPVSADTGTTGGVEKATAIGIAVVGISMGQGVDGEFNPIYLTID